MSTLKRIARACVITGLCAVIALWLCCVFSGSVVRDTRFVREYNEVSRLATKLVRSELPLPQGQESKRVEAFVVAGILSSNDAAYIREHGIEFLGFDGTRTGADIPILEGVCTNTKPPRRITGYADGHAQYRELTEKP
jgi:hypothetical protein